MGRLISRTLHRAAATASLAGLLSAASEAQVITITFEATLNGNVLPLDSIRVMNLTAGGDTMIYFPDNVLVLGSTGLADAAVQALVLRSQPNPFSDHTEILVGTDRSGQTMLQVHEATGRLEAAYAANLPAGQHRFRFTTATPGVHVLTVIQDGRRATHRMVAMTGDATGSRLTYAGGIGSSGMAKSDRSLFTWTPGDELRYIAYATDASIVQSAAINEVPTATATRTFDLFAGLVCPDAPSVTDIDGNVYPVVQIGNQCWMAENLRTTTYANGDSLPNVTPGWEWGMLTTGAWAHYWNDSGFEDPYGKLYNWYAVADPRNVCPTGWHVPTEAEWTVLSDYLGGASLAGGKMKSVGTTYWQVPNAGATNESGFSAVPGGSRKGDISVDLGIGEHGGWWSATDQGFGVAGYCRLDFNSELLYQIGYFFHGGFSVRCLRD